MVELNGSRYFLYPLLCVCLSLSVFLSGRTVVFFPPGRSRAGVIFFLAAIICWAYPMYFIKVRRLNTIKIVFVGAHFVEVGQKMFALYTECHPPTLSSSLSPSPFLSLYLPPPPPPPHAGCSSDNGDGSECPHSVLGGLGVHVGHVCLVEIQ